MEDAEAQRAAVGRLEEIAARIAPKARKLDLAGRRKLLWQLGVKVTAWADKAVMEWYGEAYKQEPEALASAQRQF